MTILTNGARLELKHAAQKIVLDKVREPTEHDEQSVPDACEAHPLVRHMGSIFIEDFLQLV